MNDYEEKCLNAIDFILTCCMNSDSKEKVKFEFILYLLGYIYRDNKNNLKYELEDLERYYVL